MDGIKITLITVCYNAESTISACIQSVINQRYGNLQYIIIDGASTDKTVEIIRQFEGHFHTLISEPDKGIYDAMNKGIAMATGEVIGMLNADDIFAADNILSTVNECFNSDLDILYGDLNVVNKQGKVIRKWRSAPYQKGIMNWGWMPPHPTFYCRRKLFEKLGNYRLDYGTAADYELMLRFMHGNMHKTERTPLIMVIMNAGGASNNSYFSRIKALMNDMRAMRENGIRFPWLTVLLKPLRKIHQYL
ncbi:glycosyltransferase family 2 protein [Mucilaginibacter gynuensis]|uniref:Glycosyltransferase family 2 protein n=1 Tax=Mucilaginibacter gynuensis TaxID=1302236 RepID=A0ABP8GPS7_9SPHI